MDGGAPRLDAAAYSDPPPSYNPLAPPPSAAPPVVTSNRNRSFEFYKPTAAEPAGGQGEDDAPGLAYLSADHGTDGNHPREDRRVKFGSEGWLSICLFLHRS